MGCRTCSTSSTPSLPPVQRGIRSGTLYQYKKLHLPLLQLQLMIVSSTFGFRSRAGAYGRQSEPRLMILKFPPAPSIAHRATVSPSVQPRHSLVPTAAAHFCSKSLGRRGYDTPGFPAQPSSRRQTPSRRGHPPESAVPRTSCDLEAMCQLRRQAERPRSALGQVCGCVALLWRHAGGFRWVRLKLRRATKGDTGRGPRDKGIRSNAVGAGWEASTGRFSRTTTITGSFVAGPRCCGKGDDECKGGINNQKWSPEEGIRGEDMESAFERGRSLARCGRRRQGRVVHRSSGELSPALGAKL